ncbi:RepB family plasmid replication initiator protein [Lactococcus hodotermopsidis]|uniref:RepB family plasmid replication initiator protein n=1 Tax=Pseudolactococcus hodotermopsidis TaxID=2709157 RepID=A0A6A0BF96_9LACT|nr:replication initiation protein [Lactococcus hodotermopsidis]GFH43446.1 RepB family plasmid replication initiator protein [Lactococcus hodotermopsidis]
MNEITRYHNSLNTIPMRKWTAEEQNFFFAILTQIRDKGTEVITFDTYQLREFADYTNRHGGDFKQTMKNLSSKLENLRYREETQNSYSSMLLFQRFRADWTLDLSEITLELRVTDYFEYIINQLNANFTQFELEQFTNLRSTYAKTMFRHIKQWRTKGVIGGFPDGEIPKDVLYQMLDVPVSMQKANNFKFKVLKPIIDELSPLFAGFKIKPIKARKQGNPIIAYKVSWKQEQTGNWVDGKFENERQNTGPGSKTPDWSDPNYKNQTTEEEIKNLEQIKKQAIEKINFENEEQTSFDI